MTANAIAIDIAAFRRLRETECARAAQRAALFAACGIDLEEAEGSQGAQRVALRRRIAVKIERERLKGARGHWSYDLDRHIALSRAFKALGAA